MPPQELNFGDWDTDTATSTNISIASGGGTFTLATTIPDSAILQTKIDEGSGSTSDDSIGTNTATFQGNPQWVSDTDYTGEYAVSLDGTNDRLVYDTTLTELDYAGTWAVGITVDKESVGDQETVFNHTKSSTNLVGVDINNGVISVGLFDGSYNAQSIAEPSAPYRIRVCAGADSGVPQIYVNTTQGSGTDQPGLSLTSGFTVGALPGGTKEIVGDIDNIIAYSAAPNAVVQEDYDAQPWS